MQTSQLPNKKTFPTWKLQFSQSSQFREVWPPQKFKGTVLVLSTFRLLLVALLVKRVATSSLIEGPFSQWASKQVSKHNHTVFALWLDDNWPPDWVWFSQGLFSPFFHLMKFGFLATVPSGLHSWGHLIFNNIIDLTEPTLLEEI